MARLLNDSLDTLEELVSDNDELNTYLQSLLSKDQIRGPPISIKISTVLPLNAVRYYNSSTGEVEIILSERFIKSLLNDYDTHPEVRFILAERLFHELGHDNSIGTFRQEMLEEAALIKRDLALHGLINRTVQAQINNYFAEKKPEFPSGYYFRFLTKLLVLSEEEREVRIADYLRETDFVTDGLTTSQLAQSISSINLSKGTTPAKFILYSGPPGGGKGAVWDEFIQRYGDLTEKFTLFHTRKIRPNETQNEAYYFRSPEHLKELESRGLIVTTLINGQLQGLPIKSFEDEYFDPQTGKKSTCHVKGLDNVFAGDKIVILEGGLGWFEKLRTLYGRDLFSIFISPFSDEDIAQKSQDPFHYIVGLEIAYRIHSREIKEAQKVAKESNEALEKGQNIEKFYIPTPQREFVNRTHEATEQVRRRGEYSLVLVNPWAATPEEFNHTIDELTDQFARVIFANLLSGLEAENEPLLPPDAVKNCPAGEEKFAFMAENFFGGDREKALGALRKWQRQYNEALGDGRLNPGKVGTDFVTIERLLNIKTEESQKNATEYFRIVNEDGSYTGEIMPRDLCHLGGEIENWHRGVFVFVVDKLGRILIQTRSLNKDHFAGARDLSVGGHTGLDDIPGVNPAAISEKAALRELEEELFNKEEGDNELRGYKAKAAHLSRISAVDGLRHTWRYETKTKTAAWDNELETVFIYIADDADVARLGQVKEAIEDETAAKGAVEGEVSGIEWVGLDTEINRFNDREKTGDKYAAGFMRVFEHYKSDKDNPETVSAKLTEAIGGIKANVKQVQLSTGTTALRSREEFNRQETAKGYGFAYDTDSLAILQSRILRPGQEGSSMRSLVAVIPESEGGVKVEENIGRLVNRMRSSPKLKDAFRQGKIILNTNQEGQFVDHITILNATAIEKLSDDQVDSISVETARSKPISCVLKGATISPVNGRIRIYVYDSKDAIVKFRERITHVEEGNPPIHYSVAAVVKPLTSEEREELISIVRAFESFDFGHITIGKFHLVRNTNDYLRNAEPIKSFDLSAHAFRPISVGGIDWAAMSAAAFSAIAYYMTAHYDQLSQYGAFTGAMLSIMALIFFATSFMRVATSLIAIYRAFGYNVFNPLHFWKALTLDIGHNKEALTVLREISPAVYNQIMRHETFPTHISGLKAFVPSAMLFLAALCAAPCGGMLGLVIDEDGTPTDNDGFVDVSEMVREACKGHSEHDRDYLNDVRMRDRYKYITLGGNALDKNLMVKKLSPSEFETLRNLITEALNSNDKRLSPSGIHINVTGQDGHAEIQIIYTGFDDLPHWEKALTTVSGNGIVLTTWQSPTYEDDARYVTMRIPLANGVEEAKNKGTGTGLNGYMTLPVIGLNLPASVLVIGAAVFGAALIAVFIARRIAAYKAARRTRAGPDIVVGIPDTASNAREAELRVAFMDMGINVSIFRVSSPEELRYNSDQVGIFIGDEITPKSISKESIRTIELAANYRIILTMSKIDDSIRLRISALIKEILGKDIHDMKAAEIFALAQDRVNMPENRRILTEQVAPLVEEQRQRLARITGYSEPILAEGIVAEKKVALVTTECVAVEDFTFGSDLNHVKDSKDEVNVFVYGEIFKTKDAAKAFVRASGYEGDLDSIVYINNSGKNYKEIINEISAKTGPMGVAEIGIRPVEGEFVDIDPALGKVLEVQTLTVNGKKILLTMNTYAALLNILKSKGTNEEIEAALEGKLPGILELDRNGIFRFLPKTLPIDYGEEIETYNAAILLLSAAA
jgi:guanylate kinase/isopentenyldiphosphate isomerase